MKDKLIVAALFLLLAPAATTNAVLAQYLSHRGLESLQEVITNIDEKASKIKSYSADFTMTMRLANIHTRMKGKLQYKDPLKIKINTTLTKPKVMEQITISDGKVLWQYVPKMNMAVKFDLAGVKEEIKKGYIAQQGDLRYPFKDIAAGTLRYIKREKGMYVLEAAPSRALRLQAEEAFSKMRIYVGIDDGLVHRLIIKAKDGTETMVQEYKNIKTNIHIDDAEFKFVPPKDVAIQERTR